MLRLGNEPFTRGRARFSDHADEGFDLTAKIYVKVALAGIRQSFLAQLDTGAAWSVLAPEIARVVGVLDGRGEPPARLRTHFGNVEGHLVRLPFTLMADAGESLETEGIFFVSPLWPSGLSFLGYSGLLDSIRFALDPRTNDFYFGP